MTVESLARPTVDDRRARRNVVVLALAQAIGGATAPINMALSGLAGAALLSADKSLATVPVTTFIVGTASGTVPAALLMRHVGRRAGFIIGLAVSVLGGFVAAAALSIASFWLLCLGTFLMGFTNAFIQQFRFAAADTASAAFRPKAISWVLAGGVAAAIIGPQAAIAFRDSLAPVPFAGAYLASSGLAFLAALVLMFLDIPKPASEPAAVSGRPLAAIARQRRFQVAALCGVGSYALMSLVMTAAPLAMVEVRHGTDAATLGIQWHVVAMFAPSFVTGSLIVRFGVERVVATGFALLAASALVALQSTEISAFYLALVFLGVGWNFGFIGATAMVADTYRPEEKAKVQALNDFLIFGMVATASFFSGRLLVWAGWSSVNMAVFPVAAVCLLALALDARGRASGGS